MARANKPKKIEITNRKAAYDFQFMKKYEAGIMLQGTEVKTLKEGQANLADAFCFFRHGELYVKGLFIAEYKYGSYYNHESRRLRKLLLRGSELRVLEKKLTEKGLALVPYKIYFTDRGFAKLELHLAQGKKSFDKRHSIKEKDNRREMETIRGNKYQE
jgi:SsrA-binding protein